MATVTPETFTMVLFDHGELLGYVEEVALRVGWPEGADLAVDVHETSPLAHIEIVDHDPFTVRVDGGALENPKRPRELSERATSATVGRLLLQELDRRRPDFEAPDDEEHAPLEHRVSWDVFAFGRLDRLGFDTQRQRRLYNFRNRHGFTDAADEAFEQLWTADVLTWPEIVALSDGARAESSDAA